MSDYTIHPLKHEEFHVLIPLMEACFGMNVPLAYFEWKFLHNPAGFVKGYIAKTSTGKVAAYYGVIPELYYINGAETVIYQSGDTMTHPEHRRKGLFELLARHCYSSLQEQNKLFIIGFGGRSSMPGLLKFGWKQLFDIKYCFFPKVFTIFQKYRYKNIYEIKNYEQISSLFLKSNQTAVIHSHKTLAGFQWRLSNPLYAYFVVAHRAANGDYDAYLCYYFSDNKLILFDYFFENATGERNLMWYLKDKLSKSTCKGIVAFVQEKSDYATLLKKHGFISNPLGKGPLSEKVPFILFAEVVKLSACQKPDLWRINSFDHDSM